MRGTLSKAIPIYVNLWYNDRKGHYTRAMRNASPLWGNRLLMRNYTNAALMV